MAFVNNYDLIVDIKKRLASPVPMFRQDDTARLTFKIYDDGVLFDLTGYSRSDVTFQLPSGESIVGNAELVGDKIVYNFVGIELVEEGEIKVTLSIYSGSTVVSVQPFVIFVYKRFNSDQASYIGILQELIVNVTQLEIDVRQAIAEVGVVKENYDKDSAKLTEALVKVDNVVAQEETRETNEAQRIINENQRITNETERVQKFSEIETYVSHLQAVGLFVAGTQYYKNNIVRDNLGNSYIALRDNKDKPLTSTTDWMLVAKRGEKGETGAGLNIIGILTSEDQLPPTGVAGDAYSINGFLYTWSEESSMWVNVGYIKGEKGDTGNSAYQVAVDNGFLGTEEEWLRSLESKIAKFNYVIPASFDGQTTLEIPLTTFSQDDDLLLVLNGTVLYETNDYTYTGNTINLVKPVKDYQSATFYLRIIKNINTIKDIPTYDGGLITDGTVTENKLSQGLLDSLKLVIVKDEFVATEGQTLFNLTSNYILNRNWIRVIVGGVEQFSPQNFTETNPTSFTLKSGVKGGTDVVAIYYKSLAPLGSDLESRIVSLENSTTSLQSNYQQLSDLLNSHVNKVASTTELGHVKVDGETITIDGDGVIKSNFKGYEVKPYSGDLNLLTETGIYEIPRATPNAPTSDEFIIEVTKTLDNKIVIQKATLLSNNNTSAILRRTGYNVNGTTPYSFRVESGAGQINGWIIDTIRLLDGINSTSIIQAPTANAVKYINDLKANKLQRSRVTMSLANGWSHSNSFLSYRKDEFGTVYVFGEIQKTGSTSGEIVATLPSGYRPIENGVFSINKWNGSAYSSAVVQIDTSGGMLVPNTYTAGTTYLHFQLSFITE